MDESASPEGQRMLNQVTEVLGTPIPPNVEGWPFPRKPVGPTAHPQKFKSTSRAPKGHSRHSRSQRGHVKGKKNIFAGWD
jgi:hypothetical protein